MARRNWYVLAIAAALFIPSLARAQQPNQPNQGGRGNFDPAQMRERFLNGIKEQMGANEEEWKVISPKLSKVMDVQRDTRGGFGFGRTRGGGSTDNQPQSPVRQASDDLRKALENKDTPAEDISKKLSALREAREKARADLQAAQKELKELLTQRQEAILVSMGMLE